MRYMSDTDKEIFLSYMNNAKYNLRTLANKLNISEKTLKSRIEGRTDFKQKEMEEIAKLFNTSPETIFFRKKEQ